MSKERLEELAYNVGISLDGDKALMSSDDYDFLYNYALEQAERAEELEEFNRILSSDKSMFIEELVREQHQNKRYREALRKIIKEGENGEYSHYTAQRALEEKTDE